MKQYIIEYKDGQAKTRRRFMKSALDRQESLTNMYSPLSQRLQKLFNKYAQLTRDAEEERVKQK